ncbi:MAG TPA: sigma-54 dependent transcriptional regulator [Nitrospira sp.]|nr:sigma-54 dependent transcriptional regulator [Nitrospira sp.]
MSRSAPLHPPILLLISSVSSSRSLLEEALQHTTWTLLSVSSPDEGFRLIQQKRDIGCVVLDEAGTPSPTEPLLSRLRQLAPAAPVIVLGTANSAKVALESLRQGAFDYLPTPASPPEVRAALLRIETSAGATVQPPCAGSSPFDTIVSRSPQMKLVKHLAAEVAATNATVLITGESGAGKELFARAIHLASPRSKGPFVVLNCAGIPEQLLESELFGYQRGAFTGATQSKPGRFQLAQGGTLFLDEIGEMSPAAQAKLLRVLEDHTVSPLGDTHDVAVNIRVIAATNEDLPARIKSGHFRLDLYYRLNVYQLRIPPLRERLEDIEPIAHAFLDEVRHDRGRRIRDISPEAIEQLRRHDWPGNVRELHNVVERLTITCTDDVVRPEHLPLLEEAMPPSELEKSDERNEDTPSLLAFGLSFQDMEKKLLTEALRQARGNISQASRLLKLTRNTVRYRMAKYGLG